MKAVEITVTIIVDAKSNKEAIELARVEFKRIHPTDNPNCKIPMPKVFEKSYREQADEIIEFLNMKTGKRYRSIANADFIIARLKEGATATECRQIIARQFREWKGTMMLKYMRPATLFNRTKFAQYLGELGSDE